MVIKEIDKRLVYQSVYWWLKFGGRPKNELYCIHDVALNIHCSICALKTS